MPHSLRVSRAEASSRSRSRSRSFLESLAGVGLCSPLDPLEDYHIHVDNGVYFPGETVSGTLTLVTNKEFPCKAVHLDIVGRGSARHVPRNKVQYHFKNPFIFPTTIPFTASTILLCSDTCRAGFRAVRSAGTRPQRRRGSECVMGWASAGRREEEQEVAYRVRRWTTPREILCLRKNNTVGKSLPDPSESLLSVLWHPPSSAMEGWPHEAASHRRVTRKAHAAGSYEE